MASREPGSSAGSIPWVATLLLAVSVERALALPEVQKKAGLRSG